MKCGAIDLLNRCVYLCKLYSFPLFLSRLYKSMSLIFFLLPVFVPSDKSVDYPRV